MARREVARGGAKVVTARWGGGGREVERAGALGRSQEAERGARGPREERHPRVIGCRFTSAEGRGWIDGQELRKAISQGTIRTLCPNRAVKYHQRRETREVLRPDLADGDPNMVVATASGDGFAPHKGALDTAARAAETMWWWDPADRADRAVDGGGAPGKTKGVVASGARAGAWRTRDESVPAGSGVKVPTPARDRARWTPWDELVDCSEAPYFRWFAGAKTNAAFNAVDRHVLDGRGDDCALTTLPEEEDPKAGVDGARLSVTRRELLGAVAAAARDLRDRHGVKPRDRVLFHMPTDATHFAYMLACQRLGAAYSATAVDSVEGVLASRTADLAPKLVIAYAEPAVHGGQTVDCAAKLQSAIDALNRSEGSEPAEGNEPKGGNERTKKKGNGRTKKASVMDPSKVRATKPAPALVLLPRWGAKRCVASAGAAKFRSLRDEDAFKSAQKICACEPCDSDHPLFVSYTSGSTGKPKGVVHGHGGYVSGVSQSMTTVFECVPGEGADGVKGGILTVGSAGWITGQSYMLMGPLLAGVRSVVMVGSPVYPTPLRMIRAVESEGCTLLKTGSAVVRQLMTDPSNAAKVDAIDTSTLRCATFCAEPVSVEVHKYSHDHITDKFINSYWATEHGAMVFSRDVAAPNGLTRRGVIKSDARTWPLPWVSAALDSESSDVVIAGPYPSLALTVFGDVENVYNSNWRGDLSKYKETYWPKDGGGFVQGDVARASGEKGGGFTFHGRSDEVINVNGNRVGTEQIERCLWNLEADGYGVKDCAVVGAPDFVKGTTPVAFVVFEPLAGGGKKRKVGAGAPDLAAFKSAAATAVGDKVGSYAAPDHIFAVNALPKTITNKTARKTLQMLLAGGEPPSGNLARAEVLPPIAEAVAEWRLTAATTTLAIDLGKYWRRYTMDDHNIQGRAIVPGAGWLALIAHEAGTSKLADVAFMRGVFEPDTTIRVVKRRRLMQATAGEETILKASLVSGDAAPETIGPDVFGRGVALGSPSKKKPARGKENGVADNGVAHVGQNDASRNKNAEAVGVKITDDSNHEQHYRRCSALRLEYGGAYRAIERVAWSGHAFRAECFPGTHLAAVLDAGLQVVCASVRANTFIPVAVADFQIAEGVDAFDESRRCVVHGEILEQHPEFLVADLRYEYEGADGSGSRGSRGKKKKAGVVSSSSAAATTGNGVFASMGRAKFARVEGVKPRLQPTKAKEANPTASPFGSQTLDPKTALARLRQLTTEQRVDAVRSVIGSIVSDLTDVDVDFSKTVFDNGMHSLNAVELLSRLNQTLGTGVTTKLVVNDAPMADFAVAVAEHATTFESTADDPNAKPFPNVDYAGLNEIVRRRLAGKTVGNTPYWFLFKYITYNFWKKSFQFFRIGGHKFLMNPPREIDLSVEVRMDRVVEFRDVDMNQHYTVEMIVARSVDGVEQLMAKSGLTHIEHYYRRNLFAAKIQSTFHKELAHGDRYVIKTKITKVTGSLMDIRVAFLDPDDVLCFEILWTILIVLDSNERLLLDWENVDLMDSGRRLIAGPGKGRAEAPTSASKGLKPSSVAGVESGRTIHTK